MPKAARFHEIFVRTTETVQAAYLADVLLKHNIPILVSGNTGTGKTIVLNDRILALEQTAYQSINITFSAQTSTRVTQDLIDSKLDKRKKGVYGPPFGKRTIIFVDDLNMPMLETCAPGSVIAAALLRRLRDSGCYPTAVLFLCAKGHSPACKGPRPRVPEALTRCAGG